MLTATLPSLSDSRVPTDTMRVGNAALTPVRDNVGYAWRNSTQECMDALAEFFPADYRDELEPHAVAAMESVLPEVWAERGYLMVPCPAEVLAAWDRDVCDAVFHAVWDEAARRIDARALVEVARLSDEYADYAGRER
jgi:hypothetical protein